MAMRMTGKTAKHSQKSATIDRHAPVWMSSKQLRVLLLALSMLAVFLPAMPNARANEASTSLAEVLETIGADELHDLGVTGAGIDIAVIDTGVNAVAGLDGFNKVIHGPDLSFESGTQFYAQDTYGHGTAMASIIAGDGDGYQGVAPGARILSLKVADNTGAVDVSQVIAALDWVTQYGQGEGLNVRVINLAYVTPSMQPYEIDPLADAVERAWEAGYVVVVSAGNEGVSTGGLTSPATDPFVIAVAAAEGEGVADFSAAGTQRIPDVMAPGNRILALAALDSRLAQEHPDAIIDGRFLRGSGTSQAAAVVSGSAALLLQQRPDLTPDQVKALLITGAVHKRGNGNNGNSNATATATVVDRLVASTTSSKLRQQTATSTQRSWPICWMMSTRSLLRGMEAAAAGSSSINRVARAWLTWHAQQHCQVLTSRSNLLGPMAAALSKHPEVVTTSSCPTAPSSKEK